MGLFALTYPLALSGQQNEENIKDRILSFAKAGDEQDVQTLDLCLDQHYRVVMNRLFGSSEVAILDKEHYLSKIRLKEFGGDQRVVNIQEILTNGNTAIAKVEFKGKKMTFTSLLTLIRDGEGQWKLISDVPIVT